MKRLCVVLAAAMVATSIPVQYVDVLAAETQTVMEQTEVGTEETVEQALDDVAESAEDVVVLTDIQDGVVVENALPVEDAGDMTVAIADSIEYALEESVDESVHLAAPGSPIVIALDPGHDAGHTGAVGNGVHEEVATLKIAQYCKKELESYYGVKVYMTREGAACPYPETVGVSSGNLLDIDRRVAASAENEAVAYVSIHLNSSDSYAAKGAEVYYHADSKEGEGLSETIEGELVKLGLYKRGAKINSAYRVTNRCQKAGFPGIIVEHAFVSNADDAKNYLSTDAKLKQLGIADATGIAQYFGLSKDKRTMVKDPDTGKYTLMVNGKPDYTYTGLESCDLGVVYIKKGILDTSFTGLYASGNTLWYIQKGYLNEKYSGFVKYQEDWWYIEEGKAQKTMTSVIKDQEGVVNGAADWWYVENGKITYVDTVAKNSKGWWCIRKGRVDFDYNGLATNDLGTWRIENGKVNFEYNGFAAVETGTWYLENGKVLVGATGLYDGTIGSQTAKWYVVKGKVTFVSDIIKVDGTWWCVHDGKWDDNFTGLEKNSLGTWYIKNGKVDFTHYGVEKNDEGWWRVEKGKVIYDFQGFAENSYGWWYLDKGQVQFKTNDVMKGEVKGQTAWWYVSGGQVKMVDTVAKNSFGWWRIENGKVNFNFNGFAENSNGIWYIQKGKVQFDAAGILGGTFNGVKGQWLVEGGKVNAIETVAKSSTGEWLYIKDGMVDTSYTGVAKNSLGWWRIENGKVNFKFNGIAENQFGSWYLVNGKVDFSYNGIVNYNGLTYKVVNGKVEMPEAETPA